jgi:multisubunit Na+/H+ antiporter MnhG subunit
VSAVLIGLGSAVTVLTALRLLVARDLFARLHFVGPATALAVPLIVAGLALRQWSSWHDVLKLALIGVLLIATGPATVVAAARARRTSDG